MARLTRDQRTSNAVGREARFGTLLRRFRADAGLTQVELAERASMSWRGIADLERGVRSSPYPSTVRRLADALALAPADRALLLAASGRTTAPVARQPLRGTGIHPPLSSLIGREHELARIGQLVGERRLLTLIGSPGVGKTRLAYEAACLQADAFADGAAAIELADVNDPSQVPRSVANSLGIGDQPGQPISVTLEDCLLDRQLLMVLDNCEHLLLACAALVDRLLRTCPGLRMIATSRAPLRVPGETVMEISALTPGAAVSLFVQRCQAHQQAFALSDTDREIAIGLCERLDGLPLAIELAAARVRALGLTEVALRLDDRFRLLTGGNRAAAPHQQTLRATLDWSYGLLSEAERHAFEAMSVFAGGAEASAIEVVCGSNADSDALDIVSGLVDQSLVRVDTDENGNLRYSMLESIREYAQQRLAASGEEDAVRARHAEIFYELATGEGLPPSGAEDTEWLARLHVEHANVRAALRWLIDARQGDKSQRLAVAAARYWDHRGHVIEGRQWLDEVLSMTMESPDAAYLEALAAAAQLARRDDDYGAVDQLVDRGLAMAKQASDPASAARFLTTRATARGFRGDFSSARQLHEQALEIWRGLDDRVGKATALNNLAIVCDQLGDFEAARAALVECIDLSRHATPGRTLASALNNLGLLLHRSGRSAEARPPIEQSLTVARERRDRYATANALGSLGLVLHDTGDLIAARDSFTESLALRREAGDRRGVAVSLQNLAAVLLDMGELARAELLLNESLGLFDELHSSWGVAEVLETMSCIAAAQSDVQRAEDLLAQADEIRHRLAMPRPAPVQARLNRWTLSVSG